MDLPGLASANPGKEYLLAPWRPARRESLERRARQSQSLRPVCAAAPQRSVRSVRINDHLAIQRDTGLLGIGVEAQRQRAQRLGIELFKFPMRTEAESKDACTGLRRNRHMQRVGAAGQREGSVLRAAKPGPRIANRPQITVVLFTTRKKEVFAVSGPVSRRLVRRPGPAPKNSMQAVAIRRHLPQRLSAILPDDDGETNIFSIRGPRRTARMPVQVSKLANLRPVTMDRI